jgi:transporter family-2 protein
VQVTQSAPSAKTVLAVAASIVSGVGVAIQSRLNGELGLRLEDGSLAALISFSSGLLILAVALGFSPRGRAGLRQVIGHLRGGQLPWWSVLGGVAGGLLVLTQGLVAGILGVALFSVAVVAGQTLGAFLIDTKGLVGRALIPLSATRVLGVVIVVVGVVTTVGLWSGVDQVGWAIVLPLVAGAGTGFQQALNGTVRRASESALAATFINFSAGTAVLVVITAVMSPLSGPGGEFPTEWWVYLGGFVGTLFIAIQTVTVNHIGVLGLGVSLVAGQVLGSLVLDVASPVSNHPITAATVIGAALTLIGSIVVTLARRRES